MPLRRLLGRVAWPLSGTTPRVCVSLRLDIQQQVAEKVEGTPQAPRPPTGSMSMRRDPARRPRRRTFQELPSRRQAVRLLATENRRRGSIPPPRVHQSGRLPSSLQHQMQGTEARTTEEEEKYFDMKQNHWNTLTDLGGCKNAPFVRAFLAPHNISDPVGRT